MGVRTLKEDFQRMGLNEELAEDSVTALFGDTSGGELDEDQDDDDVLSVVESYKGVRNRAGVPKIKTKKTGAKYGYDAIHDHAIDSAKPPTGKGNEYRLGEDEDEDDDDDMSEDALAVLEAYKYEKKRKVPSSEKARGRQKRRSGPGKVAARRSAKKAALPMNVAKRKKRQAKMPPAKKGYRRVQSWFNYDGEGDEMREDILENLSILAEAIDKDPTDRFNEFVEAFNHIADIGEILTLRYHEMGEEDMAEDAIQLATSAEGILEQMEELGGALTLEADAALEQALAEAMEDTAEYMSDFEELAEEYEDLDEEDFDEDEDDEPSDILSAARRIAEAAKVAKGKGRLKGKAKKGKGKKKKKKAKMGQIKKKTSKLSKFEKALTKSGSGKKRKDIKNPEALGGYLRWYGPFNKKTGRSRGY